MIFMKKTARMLVGLFCLPVVISGISSGCSDSATYESSMTNFPNVASSFAIYKVDKNNLEEVFPSQVAGDDGGIVEDKNVDLNKVKLEDEPILTDQGIKYYDWKDQKIILTEEYLVAHGFTESDKAMSEYIDYAYRDGGSKLLSADQDDAAVIVFNGKRIYSVGFPRSLTSSNEKPPVMIEDVGRGVLKINNYSDADDLRLDKQIYEFFKKEGKLKE
jgi:hypothetical protein